MAYTCTDLTVLSYTNTGFTLWEYKTEDPMQELISGYFESPYIKENDMIKIRAKGIEYDAFVKIKDGKVTLTKN